MSNDGHLRCPSKLHAIIDPSEKEVEIVCKSQFCGAGKGIVILHTWNLTTKSLIRTRRFKNVKGEKTNGLG